VLDELYNFYRFGIPCTVTSDTGCNKGRCGDNCAFDLLSKEDLERAKERIEEYFNGDDPEIRASNELPARENAQACGSPVGAGAGDCPDCVSCS